MSFWKKLLGESHETGMKNLPEKFMNRSPGDIVPQTGEWKCNVCMRGGMIDVMLQGLMKKRKLPTRDLTEARLWFLKDADENPSLGYALTAKSIRATIEGKEVVRFFREGEKFDQCPNCEGATGWTINHIAEELARKVMLKDGR